MSHNAIDSSRAIESVLQARAQATAKTIVGLEGAERQTRTIVDLPDAAAIVMLRNTLARAPDAMPKISAILTSRLQGDIEAIGRLTVELEGASDMALFDPIMVRHNVAWAKWLAAIQGSGLTVFVAVGAGHLTGPGNSCERLQHLSVTIERVPEGTSP